MLNNLSFIRKCIFCIFFLTFIFSPVFAENIDTLREQAKTAYFSGDLESSLSVFLTLSETGDAESQYYAGLIYLTEGWSGINREKAMSYLTTAADQNSIVAMWKIGEIYENGWGVKKDILIALDWYRKSKQSAVITSQIKFMKLENEKFVTQPTSEVVMKLKKAAKKNNAEAKFILANVYDEGRLMERDLQKAFYWYHEAAIREHSYSMLMLGYFLCRGIGVDINKEKANDWLIKSGRKAYCN